MGDRGAKPRGGAPKGTGTRRGPADANSDAIDGGGTISIAAKESPRFDADDNTWRRISGCNEFARNWKIEWDGFINKYEAAPSQMA